MKRGNYNCYVLYLSKRKVRGKTKYLLKNWEVFYGVTKTLACYYAQKNGGEMIGFDQPFTKTANIPKAKHIYSYSRYNHVLCIVQKYKMTNGRGWGTNYPLHPKISAKISTEIINRIVELFGDRYNGYDKDYSIQASHEWGPENLIPQGYEHITSGEVMQGDLYWNHDTDMTRECWYDCELSYSSFKPGTPIKLRGFEVIYKDKGSKRFQFYEPFVIRKKQ